jgi:hypothetical protein
MTRRFARSVVLSSAIGLSIAMPLAAQPPATSPAAAPTTAVLATLSVKPDVQRPDIMKVMPQEVRDTVVLYLDGKIQQWYARADGRGVVFVLNAKSIEEAKAMTEQLPLMKAGLVTFDYLALTPLTPLRALVSQP